MGRRTIQALVPRYRRTTLRRIRDGRHSELGAQSGVLVRVPAAKTCETRLNPPDGCVTGEEGNGRGRGQAPHPGPTDEPCLLLDPCSMESIAL